MNLEKVMQQLEHLEPYQVFDLFLENIFFPAFESVYDTFQEEDEEAPVLAALREGLGVPELGLKPGADLKKLGFTGLDSEEDIPAAILKRLVELSDDELAELLPEAHLEAAASYRQAQAPEEGAEGEGEQAEEGEGEQEAEAEEEEDAFSEFSTDRSKTGTQAQTAEMPPQDRNYVRDLWSGFAAPAGHGGRRRMPAHLFA